jgi:hypothetical protein
MLDLPLRGDVVARRWWLVGMATYLTLASVFVITLASSTGSGGIGEIIGMGSRRNYTVAALVIGGILLVAVTFAGVFWEIYESRVGLRDEEADVEWVRTHGRRGLGLVFAEPRDRERLFAAGERMIPHEDQTIETLVDDRVWHVEQARRNPAASGVSPEELRGIAQQRTLRFGSFARYAASLLLLLAVLGTFAGVKTALPELIDAVASAGTDSSSASSIVGPLQAVADAFGGNALALIGAIAVGLAGHGMAVGRRHFLERLEIVSVKFIYGEESAQTTDSLQAAVHALRRTAEEFRSSNGALLGIQAGLESLGSEFNKSISTLDDRIVQALTQQERGMYERTATRMQEVERRVGELADAVRGNALQYTALIDQVGGRTQESRVALQQMQQANERLTQALEGLLSLGEASRSASAEVTSNVRTLVRGTKAVQEQIAVLGDGIRVAQPVIDQLDTSLRTSVAALQGLESRALENWQRVGDQLVAQLGQGLKDVARSRETHPSMMERVVPGDGGGGMDREALGVLRRIAASLDDERDRSDARWRLAIRTLTVGAAVALVIAAARLGWLAMLWPW